MKKTLPKGFATTPIPHTDHSATTSGIHTNSRRYEAPLGKIGVNSHSERGFIPYESKLSMFFKPGTNLGCGTRNFRTGFTLIELLVVISIIALLSSVILAALNQAKARARDASILADIRTLATAMELYYDDYGYYPPASNSAGFLGSFTVAQLKGDGTNSFLKSKLNPYLKQLPNPSTYVDQSYKGAGWGFSIGGYSRISYNRPWAYRTEIYNRTGLVCGVLGQWGGSTDCYILTVRTETATTLGPAETRIYLIVGKNRQAKIIDTNNDYTWGLW